MTMTRQERKQRDAAFELLLADMRGWRKSDSSNDWTREPAEKSATTSAIKFETESGAGRRGEQNTERELPSDIAAARRKRGWTQEELARRAGTTQPAIARLERGRTHPRLETLRRLAEALGARLVVRLEVD
jgi:ribosome-binding protein aMBF1 (putative translation factor)